MKSDKVELVKARLTATAALGREPPRAAQHPSVRYRGIDSHSAESGL